MQIPPNCGSEGESIPDHLGTGNFEKEIAPLAVRLTELGLIRFDFPKTAQSNQAIGSPSEQCDARTGTGFAGYQYNQCDRACLAVTDTQA